MDVPSCSSKQIIRAALRLGFIIKPGGKGSHTKLEHRQNGQVIVVPETKDVGKGLRTKLVQTIASISERPPEEVVRLLTMSGVTVLIEIMRHWFR